MDSEGSFVGSRMAQIADGLAEFIHKEYQGISQLRRTNGNGDHIK
jgi:hypothetical protein